MDGRLRRSSGALPVEIVVTSASLDVNPGVTLFVEGKNFGDAVMRPSLSRNDVFYRFETWCRTDAPSISMKF